MLDEQENRELRLDDGDWGIDITHSPEPAYDGAGLIEGMVPESELSCPAPTPEQQACKHVMPGIFDNWFYSPGSAHCQACNWYADLYTMRCRTCQIDSCRSCTSNPYQFAAKFGPVDDGEVEELDENELNVVDNFRRGASLESVSDERGETAGQTTSASLLTQVIERGHQAATAFDDGAKRHLNWAQTLFYEAEVAFEEADERFKEAQMQRQNALDHVEELRPSLERLEARYLDALNRLIPRE